MASQPFAVQTLSFSYTDSYINCKSILFGLNLQFLFNHRWVLILAPGFCGHIQI